MKRVISVFLCILLLASVTAAFADGGAMQVFGVGQTEKTLDILLYTKSGASSAKNFNVTADGRELEVLDTHSYRDSDYGTSWILVIAPTAYNDVVDMAQDIIDILVADLEENDNVAVANAATGAVTAFTNSKEVIMSEATDALKDSGKIHLYDSIDDALDIFATRTSLAPRKCMMILSTGVDNDSSSSIADLCAHARKLPVGIYNIGLTRNEAPLVEEFHELNSLVQTTGTGMSIEITDLSNNTNPGTILADIDENERNCLVLSTSSDGLKAGEVELRIEQKSNNASETFRVELESSGNKSGQNGKSVQGGQSSSGTTQTSKHEHVWTDATCTEPKTCSLCGETEGEALGHDYGSTTFFKTGTCSRCGEKNPDDLATWDKAATWAKVLMIVGAVILLALIVLAVILLIRKIRNDRLRKEEEEWRRDQEDNNVTVAAPRNGTGYSRSSEGRTMPLGKVTITMTNVSTGERFTGEIQDQSITAGRSSKFRLSGDGSISGKHMTFVWQNGVLYVQDENSTNGTFVNGNRISRAVSLNQNDRIGAGKTDFYVTWKTNR
ncbi:MAG: FHA domain-containing protein [Oscillospiraceae bacterium]|nr:FHA domain-containing protein [Oscillospiraceae bacterium]